jgi:two-component system, LytTR family, sensor histidine kinase AlgZ
MSPLAGAARHEFAQGYFSIEQYRSDERLQLDVRVGVALSRAKGTAPTIRRGVGGLSFGKPREKRKKQRASSSTTRTLANIAGRRTALFGARASLSVDRGDGRHFTCLAILVRDSRRNPAQYECPDR